ncbi:MAG TPA: hypothetical protein VHY84_11535 [Bryobacteraceae bacterium]|jgi:hypothetical protein|nr:hypothetical protein [Bryobacteraceae bacterium]
MAAEDMTSARPAAEVLPGLIGAKAAEELFRRGRRPPAQGNVFEHSRGMGFESASMSGGLTSKLCLNFRLYVNGDRHRVFPFRIIFSPCRLFNHPVPLPAPSLPYLTGRNYCCSNNYRCVFTFFSFLQGQKRR